MKSLNLIYGTTTSWINAKRNEITAGKNTLFFSGPETMADFFQNIEEYPPENLDKTMFIVSTNLIAQVPIIGLLCQTAPIHVVIICHYEPERLLHYINPGLNPVIHREA